MASPIYKRGDCELYVAYSTKPIYSKREKRWIPSGSVYYTVVNTKLNVHRHYRYEKQAFFICKRAGMKRIPEHYNGKAKRDIEYLITGDKSVYKK